MEPRTLKDMVQVPVESILDPINALWTKLATSLPSLLGVILLLGVGLLVSQTLRRITVAILGRAGFDRASSRIGLRRVMDNAGVDRKPSELLGNLVFWLFMLTFLISAADAVGLSNVSRTIDAFVRYLPNVIGATLILVAGLTLAEFVKDLVAGGARSAGVEYGRALGQLAHAILLIVTVGLAVGQLQIETHLFNRVVEILLISSGVAVALSLGLGSQKIAHHLIAGIYARDVIETGKHARIGDSVGIVVEVGPIFTKLRDDEGKETLVPNGQIAGSSVHLETPKA